MRKFSKQSEEAEVNMTPMLDIVFIMLIFFIVTATFIKETGIEVNKPEDNQNKNPPPPDEEKRAIAFVIDSTSRIRHELRTIDIASVASIIKRESVERPEAPVVIQASEGAKWGVALAIYDEALNVGIDRSQLVMVRRQ